MRSDVEKVFNKTESKYFPFYSSEQSSSEQLDPEKSSVSGDETNEN